MPANTAPIFPLTPKVEWDQSITAANTAKDGTGTVDTIFTAGANGSHVSRVIFQPLGTNVATVARVFLNNGSTNATASNNTLIGQIGLTATTNTETAAIFGAEMVLGITLPAGYKLNVVLGTAVSAGYSVTAIGGDY